MPLYTQQSLEALRDRIDLIEVVSSFIDLKKQGKTYKGCCPFHEEKTPSFMIQIGQNHYHCFGCGAHGDAIAFLMQKQSYSFAEAVEYLANLFHVPLQKEKGAHSLQISDIKKALQNYTHFCHQLLLFSQEGREALNYLYARGLTLEMITQFQLGYAPVSLHSFLSVYPTKYDLLIKGGLMTEQKTPFFKDRILFPVHSPLSYVVGFSARKYKDSTGGGKYINTSETPLFHKSKVFFGMHLSRNRIIQEKKAILVEGQLDAMALIHEGLDYAIAPLGTAFTPAHVEVLKKLHVETVILAFDSDAAGQKAAVKAGDLLQKEKIGVFVAKLPLKEDPFSYLQNEGLDAMHLKLKEAQSYLEFLVSFYQKAFETQTPEGKNRLVETITTQVKQWDHPILVHETLKRLAKLVQIPSSLITKPPEIKEPAFKQNTIPLVEKDLFAFLLTSSHQDIYLEWIKKYLQEKHFQDETSRKLYHALQKVNKASNLLELFIHINDQSWFTYFEQVTAKKIKKEKQDKLFVVTLQKLLDQRWIFEKQEIQKKIQNTQDPSTLQTLIQAFDQLNQSRVIVDPIEIS